MPFYTAPFTFDFQTSLINVDSGTTDVDCAALYTAIKLAQASEEGIVYAPIATGTGLVELGPGVQVGLTVELLGTWQLRFAVGNYIARVAGGNLVGGPAADPIAYSAGVQVLLIQSAASTIVTSSVSGIAGAVWGAIDTANNVPGTMGAKLNSAASAGDPWSTSIPGLYAPGSAGYLMSQLALENPAIALQLSEVWMRLGLDSANPLVNTDTLISAGPTLQLDVDSNTSGTTLTRQ